MDRRGSWDELDLHFPSGDWGRYWLDDSRYGGIQEVAWSLDGTMVVARVPTVGSSLETGQLLVLDPTVMGGVEASDVVDFDHQEPRVLPGESWKLPTFRRDGRLVVAEQQTTGQWLGVVLDIGEDNGAEVVPIEDFVYGSYNAEPLDQDFDPSGEWLLTVVREPEAEAGVLRWLGPDGQIETLPGRYFAASW